MPGILDTVADMSATKPAPTILNGKVSSFINLGIILLVDALNPSIPNDPSLSRGRIASGPASPTIASVGLVTIPPLANLGRDS